MYFIKQALYPILIAFITINICKAQETPAFRWEPGISIKNKLAERWTATLQLKARTEANNYSESEWNPSILMMDARGYLAYTLFNQSRLQLGYLIRINNPFEGEEGYERRLMQQYSFFNDFGKHRLSQTITLEERMINNNFIGRFRYGVGDDFPLQGEVLDRGEYFLVSKIEFLYSFNSYSSGLENRCSVGIGKLFTSGHKFTLDIESRYADLIQANRSFILQLNTIYYLNW